METDSIESGHLDKVAITLPSAAHRRTKEIYGVCVYTRQLPTPYTDQLPQLQIDGKSFVAKKLVNIGNGCEDIDPALATKYLTADLICLYRMSAFTQLFFQHARNEGAEVAGVLLCLFNFCRILNLTDRFPSIRWIHDQALQIDHFCRYWESRPCQ